LVGLASRQRSGFRECSWRSTPAKSARIETKQGFHIIKLEGKRVVRIGGTPQRQVRVRQILISPDDPDKSPRQLAQETIEREKQEALIAQIVRRSHVTMPEDFQRSAATSRWAAPTKP
jgi:hypothetical protein